MKKQYEEAVAEIIALTAQDIIVTSPTPGCTPGCSNETEEDPM